MSTKAETNSRRPVSPLQLFAKLTINGAQSIKTRVKRPSRGCYQMAKLRTVSCLVTGLAFAGKIPLWAKSFSTRFDKNSSSDSILIHRFSVIRARAARGLESFLEMIDCYQTSPATATLKTWQCRSRKQASMTILNETKLNVVTV